VPRRSTTIRSPTDPTAATTTTRCGNGNHAVVRRYEFYKYAGVYDAVTHEALCADLTCTAPSPGELGDAIGAQNAAGNLDVNALTVTIGGGGTVSSSDKVYSCGNRCYGVYNPGSTVTLTAKANSGNTFAGWSGACIGNAPTCTVTMNAESRSRPPSRPRSPAAAAAVAVAERPASS